MDENEKHVKKFLDNLGLGDVKYEPIPNSTPDFLIDGRIAVEATCLMEQIFDLDGTARPLNSDTISILRRIPLLLSSLGSVTNNECWWVCIDFGRPIPEWKRIKKELPKRLKESIQNPIFDNHGRIVFFIDETFRVWLIPSATESGNLFRQGTTCDYDSGGLILQKFEKNIIHSIKIKNQKIAPQRRNYNEWWLVLVDTIGNGQYEQLDIQWLKQNQLIPKFFDRTIVLSLNDISDYFDL